jgi:thiol-disulfide isomerase/thioredoxin
MRRRDLLAGIGGLAVVGGGTIVATRSQTEESVEPVTVEQLGRDGTVVGERQVPQRGQPTLLTVFATWCSICRRTMPEVATVHGDAADVQFVSVTNEAIGQTTTREDVADWWRSHGGDWPVAVDTDLELTAAFDVRSVPHTVVLDADNRIVYEDQGEKTAAELRDALAKT